MNPTTRPEWFFSATAVRADLWREMLACGRAWASRSDSEDRQAAAADALDRLKPIEAVHGFPGPRRLALLDEALAQDDASGFTRLVQDLSNAMLSGSFRHYDEEDAEGDGAETSLFVEHLLAERTLAHRPYFELLIVTPQPASSWPQVARDMLKLRRREDEFIYVPVVVGSFEDAVLAAMINGAIQSVIIADGFAFRLQHDAPLLRELLKTHAQVDQESLDPEQYTERLCWALHRLRPELDLFVLSDRHVEAMAGDPRFDIVERIFYQVEEPMEIHLSILNGIADRYRTPYFDNLKKYARRPIATFHALPVARGKSIFKSNWIRDMGHFYGENLFLAESSATSGGLDSLLEPKGNIKDAQDLAARAFGADRVFFVTNGTSTSNKMVYQGIVRPGDIVLIDRNCHKSHHYGLVLSGGQPFYIEAFPLTDYSMYGAVPLQSLKKALLELKAEGKLDRARMVTLTNCTFDGHVYHPEKVMLELLAIKPDLIFLWDEAWFGSAYFSPFFRRRTAMGARAALRAMLEDPVYRERHARQVEQYGEDLDPADERLLTASLLPDPDKVCLRVYQTNSTHKSMSSLRQGSMLLVGDERFDEVEENFKEAVFTHASTSPNLQIIASLDIARRQMELEGYELVMNAFDKALSARRAINGHPLISKYFRILGASELIPGEFRESGFTDYLAEGTTWLDAVKSLKDDEFALDPTRLTLVCGTAGYDGTSFKALLSDDYDIQVNKTSRNSVLLQTNINNTRGDIAHLVRVLVAIARKVERELARGGNAARVDFEAKVKSLMKDVPDLPNFSTFHDAFREAADSKTVEGDMRSAFFVAYYPEKCEHIPLFSQTMDDRLKNGPTMISANFVIPYPPGFPIMVPGQVVTDETIEFMRKLDVKEIHGFDATHGLKLIKENA